MVLSLFVTLAITSGMIWWEVKGENLVEWDIVIAAKKEIKKGSIIGKDDVEKTFVIKKYKWEGLSENEMEFIGKTSAINIPVGEPINKFMLKDMVVVSKNNVSFEFPREWLISFPATVRKGDQVKMISAVATENGYNTKLFNGTVINAMDINGGEVHDEQSFSNEFNVLVDKLIISLDQNSLNEITVIAKDGGRFLIVHEKGESLFN